MTRRIFHIDLDAFFVAVERARDPSLNGKPVVVGGDPKGRGVVASASYEARPYGLHAGMPLAQAYRLCPQAIFLQGRFDDYVEVSQSFMDILAEYTPFLQPLGLDEAFLDMTGFESLYGPLNRVALAIKERVKGELRITASIGIASSKVTAKVASDRCKPDGLLEVSPGGDEAFLAPLPAGQLSGVGEKTDPILLRIGITTIGQLAATPPVVLRRALGARGDLLHLWAQGIDDSPVAPPGPPKSMGRETTFPQDTRELAFLQSTLRYLAEQVGADLRQERKRARCVAIKLRWADFTTITRQETLKAPSDTDEAIYGTGVRLLLRELEHSAKEVRLLGIGVSNLLDPGLQMPLLEEERSRRLALALDALRQKHGYTAIQRGLTLALRGTFPEERGRYLLKTACLSR